MQRWSGGVSITSFTTIVSAPVGIESASLTLFFSLTKGIVKKLLNTTRKKKEKYDKILMLAKSKLNSIETLISQALIDLDITHEEFIRILKEKEKCVQDVTTQLSTELSVLQILLQIVKND